MSKDVFAPRFFVRVKVKSCTSVGSNRLADVESPRSVYYFVLLDRNCAIR